MAIRFKYTLPENLVPLVNETIVDYGYDYVYGLLPEELSSDLRHCSLYMICELEFVNNMQVWRNPVAIVAHNDVEAMEVYVTNMGKNNGSVLCEIVNRCDNIVVEPC
jgi:hypothetical protein